MKRFTFSPGETNFTASMSICPFNVVKALKLYTRRIMFAPRDALVPLHATVRRSVLRATESLGFGLWALIGRKKNSFLIFFKMQIFLNSV